MSNSNFNKAIEESRKDFLIALPQNIDRLKKVLVNASSKERREVEDLLISNFVREIHNLKSVAGSYGFDFVVSACRNILDHSSYFFDADKNSKVSFEMAIKIFDLLADFVENSEFQISSLHKLKLDSLLTSESSKKRVLLVEKDNRLIEHFKKIFDKYEIMYSIASNGHDALGRLLDERFDLLITDLHVGKLDGPSLIASTRVSNGVNRSIKTLMLCVSYFDLLPSVSMPDYFISKNEKILVEFENAISRFLVDDEVLVNEKIKILSLDDDKNIHDLLKISFKSHDLDYFSALNTTEFIKQFKKIEPNIVLLDLVLENESGIDAIRALKKEINGFDIPVIVLTSLNGELKNELLSEIPFVIGCLSKPFTPKDMAKDVLNLYQRNKMSFMFKK